MNASSVTMNIHTHIALTALRNAYEKCSDMTAQESIMTASNAITLLHYDLGTYISSRCPASENVDDFDPSEYCAAV